MPLPREQNTSKDYWSLPEGARAELIDGQFYNMAPPSRIQFAPIFFPFESTIKVGIYSCLSINIHQLLE